MKKNLIIIIVILITGVCFGHTWMAQWTPEGWTSCLGPHMTKGNLANNKACGEIFLLDAQAREKPEEYRKVLRAQWFSEVLGEEKGDGMIPGSGGFWESLAYEQTKIIVGKPEEKPKNEPVSRPAVKIPEDDKKVAVNKDGIITIPAIACTDTGPETGKVLFMKSYEKGMQLHVPRQGKELSVFNYKVNLPKKGKYKLSAKVVTIHNGVKMKLSVNNSTPLEMSIPYTIGNWDYCKPVLIGLKKGENNLDFSGHSGSNGVTIKQFILTPVE